MKSVLLLGLVAASVSLNVSGKEPATTGFKTDKQKFSYAVGHQMGQNIKRQNLEIEPKIVAQGMQDALTGAKPKITPEDMQAAVHGYQKKEQEKMESAAKKNLEAGQAFLEANKKKEGIVALPSGLQYKIITEGKGKQPKSSDTVVAHYRGSLVDGSEFDSSYKRNEPATFPLEGVIKGWQEILPLMKEGSKWQVYIPSELGYGSRGAGSAIGPNQALIFDIELISIKNEAEGKDTDKKEKESK
jgi:FKBP-type peptidyl-prolyl cis-trans isomerase FklB